MNKLFIINMFFNNIIFKAPFVFCCLEINVFTPTSYFSCVSECVCVCAALCFGVLFYFRDGFFLCSPSYTGTGYVVQGGLKLMGIPSLVLS